MWQEFRKFIERGNVLDLAIGVIIGAAFGRIVNTLVEGVLMPPIGLLLRGVDFANMMWVLDASKGVPASLADAKAKSIPVIAYGQLITDFISFVIVAFVVFLIVRQVNAWKSAPPAPPATKDCPFCLTHIPVGATRCPACTSELRP
jgi:large conductance mechanosensitive channel